MATIVDELVVRLGLDSSGFARGRTAQKRALDQMRDDASRTEAEIRRIHAGMQRSQTALGQQSLDVLRKNLDAKRRAIRELETPQKNEIDREKKHAESIGAVKGQLLGLFGVLLGAKGVADFAVNTVRSSAAIGRFSKNIGVATKDLSAWQTVVEQNGGTAEDAIGTLHALAQAYQDVVLRGDTAKLGALQGLGQYVTGGLSLDDMNKPLVFLQKLQEAQKHMSPAEFENRVTELGIAPGAIAALQAGPLGAALDRARKSAVTDQDAETSKRLQSHAVEAQKDASKIARGALLRGTEAVEAAGRAGSAAMHGDGAGARAAMSDFNRAMSQDLSGASRQPSGASRAMATAETAGTKAFNIIKGYEGFRDKAYWDRTAWRVGYGSDTTTDKAGRVRRVTKDTTTDKASAVTDLIRRINTEFYPRAQKAIGEAWEKLTAAQRAAIISLTYNYGTTPLSVVKAAQSGDALELARAILARQFDNEGVNAGRRQSEAALAAGGAVSAGAHVAASRTAPASTSTSTSQVDVHRVNVYTNATDADGIARAIPSAIKRAYVPNFNTGLTV